MNPRKFLALTGVTGSAIGVAAVRGLGSARSGLEKAREFGAWRAGGD